MAALSRGGGATGITRFHCDTLIFYWRRKVLKLRRQDGSNGNCVDQDQVWANCGADRPTELFPYHWDVVGQPAPKIVIGKGSGIDSIKARLKSMGVSFTEEEAMKVVMAVKDHSMETKDLLTDEEFNQVVKATLPQAVGA